MPGLEGTQSTQTSHDKGKNLRNTPRADAMPKPEVTITRASALGTALIARPVMRKTVSGKPSWGNVTTDQVCACTISTTAPQATKHTNERRNDCTMNDQHATCWQQQLHVRLPPPWHYIQHLHLLPLNLRRLRHQLAHKQWNS